MLDMYKNRHSHIVKHDEFHRHYKIIETTIDIQDHRIFNLMLAEHKVLFDEAYKGLIAMNSKLLYRAPEGKVINYLFQSLELNGDYDCVLGLFRFNRSNYSGTRSRIGFMPQLQLCMKNNDLFHNEFIDFDYTEHLDTFDYLLSKYYFERIKRG